MRLILMLCAITLGLPATAQTEARQFGNIIYDLPSDWYLGRDDDGWQVILSDHEDDRCEFCYIHFGSSKAATGDILGFLADNHLRFVDEDDREGYEVQAPPEATTLAGRPAALTLIRDCCDFFIVVAVDLGDRYEMMGFEGGGGDDTETSIATFQAEVMPIFEGVRFVSAGAPSLLPAPVPGGMNGLWAGWDWYTSVGLDGMMTMESYFETIVFHPNGTFYSGTPDAGLRPFDAAALNWQANTNHGVYVERGGVIDMTFANGETTQMIPGADGSWEFDGTDIRPVRTLPDGSRLDGSISWVFFSGFTPGSGLSGGVSAASDTVFLPDGRYGSSSFGGAFGGFDSGGGFATSSGDEVGGTYAIRDGLLIMTPADGGDTRTRWVFLYDDGVVVGEEFLE